MRNHRVITSSLRLLLIVSSLLRAQSYIAGNPNEAVLSNVECELLVTIGRLPSTTMPPEWAASGAKLGLPLKVKFSNEACDYEMNKERLLGSEFPPFLSLEPLNEPTFVSVNGLEKVKVSRGAYYDQIQDPDTKQYAFRFFLDFPEGAARNDVILPAGRIYFMTACWKKDDGIFQRAIKWKEDVLKSIRQIDDELEQMKQSPKGLIEKALKVRQYGNLLKQREISCSQIDMLDERFPLDPGRLCNGPNNVVFLKDGVVAVKGKNTNEDRYDWVGTFQFKFFEDEKDN